MEPNGRRQDPQARNLDPPRATRRPRGMGAAGLVALVISPLALGGAGIAQQAFADPNAKMLFPLSVGDTWNYERSGRLAQVRITDSFQYRDRLVYRVQGYLFGFSDADVLFFVDRNGMLAELNPALAHVGDAPGRPHPVVPLISGVWYPWSDLGRRVVIPSFARDCIHGTRGTMKSGDRVAVPAGDFADALTIRYDTHPCADQDLVSESFAPGIGLVARTVTTFVGEERWALTSAIVGGQLIGPLGGQTSDQTVGDPSRKPIVKPIDPALGDRGAATAPAREPDTWGSIKAAFAR